MSPRMREAPRGAYIFLYPPCGTSSSVWEASKIFLAKGRGSPRMKSLGMELKE